MTVDDVEHHVQDGTVLAGDVRPLMDVLEEHTPGASGSGGGGRGGGGRIEGWGRDSWNVGKCGVFFFVVVVT
jgi:hypothetical protein